MDPECEEWWECDSRGFPIRERNQEDRRDHGPTDKDVVLRTHLHYTDPWWQKHRKEMTVFGRAKPGLFYNYSDRLWGWDYSRMEEAHRRAQEAGLNPKTARYFEAVLNHFHNTDTVNLQHILVGVNHSTLYDYLVFGYTYTSSPAPSP